MNYERYLQTVHLEYLVHTTKDQLDIVGRWMKKTLPDIAQKEREALCLYLVPKLGDGGACSITDELEDQPYSIAETLGIDIENDTKSIEHLWRLQGMVNDLFLSTNVDWLGIYYAIQNARGEHVLLKVAYKGEPSRAEFPLTHEFAQHSNNATVGRTGEAVVFQDITTYQGPYYKCDAKVQSECCVPMLHEDGTVCGILDAESFQKQHFTSDVLRHITYVAHQLGSIPVPW